MKTRCFTLLLTALFVLFIAVSSAAAAPNVKVNGDKLKFDVDPVIEEGSTLVPLRTIFEALGADVDWDAKTKTVFAVKGNTIIELTINESKAVKNNTSVKLNVPAQIVNSKTMVPLRFVGESLGVKVDWNSSTRTITIDDKGTKKGNIKLGYVNWESEIASIHVVKNILESRGYGVTLEKVEENVMWYGVSKGDFDAIVSAWLPGTHKDYYNKYQDKIVNLGPNLENACIGLAVPEYMDINSIGELNKVKEDVDGKIIGVEKGAGVMKVAREAIKEYGLDLELESSSTATMMNSMYSKMKNKQPAVITSWRPIWLNAALDIKFLEDPKGVFGGTEHISTIAREGLKEDMPQAYRILDNFYWSMEDIEQVMLYMKEGMNPEEAAIKWIKNNQEKVSEWTQGIEKVDNLHSNKSDNNSESIEVAILGLKKPVNLFDSLYTSDIEEKIKCSLYRLSRQEMKNTKRLVILYETNKERKVPDYLEELVPEIKSEQADNFNTTREGKEIVLIKAPTQEELIEEIKSLPSDILFNK